MKKQTV